MKKTVFCVFFIMAAGLALADKITIGGVTAMQFVESQNRVMDRKVAVQYDTKEKRTYLYFEDVMGTYAVILDEKKKAALLGMLSNYLQIEKAATAKGVKMEKRLGDIMTSLYFKYGDKWYMSRPDMPVFVKFFSQSGTVHQLVFMYGSAFAEKDASITLSPSNRYFSRDQAEKLYGLLKNGRAGIIKQKAQRPTGK